MDISNVPEAEKCLLDNYIPNLLNGKIINGIDKEWNPKNLIPQFVVSEQIDLHSIVVLNCIYYIFDDKNLISSGKIEYNVTNGELYNITQSLTTNLISYNEIKVFLQHLIICFGATNYLEKCIAKQRAVKVKSKTNNNDDDLHRKIKIEKPIFDFQDNLTQDMYIPKDIKVKKTRNKKETIKKNVTTNKIPSRRVYKVPMWQYHGYYLRNGTYIPPGYKHRHVY